MSLAFALLNESTVVDGMLGGPLTDEILAKIAAACELQLNTHVAFAWGGDYAVRPVKVRSDVTESEVPIVVRDLLPEASDVSGYHSTQADGRPVIFIARDTSELVTGPTALSVTIAHECIEAAIDPAANRWAEAEDGNEYALEGSDAVESFAYDVAGVSVSDFLFPEFFCPRAKGPYSYLAKPSAPFETAGAAGGDYQILRHVAPDGAHQVTAKGLVHPSRRARKRHPTSRSWRRGLRV